MSGTCAALFRFLAVFLPPTTAVGSREFHRGRLSVAFSWLVGAGALVFAQVYPLVATPARPTTQAAVNALAVVLLLLPLVLRWTGSLPLVAALLVISTESTLALIAWASHGIGTPALFFLPGPILLGVAVGGRRLGAAAAVGALAVAVVLAWVEIAGLESFPPVDPNPLLWLLILGFAVVLVACIGLFLEAAQVVTLTHLRRVAASAEAANEAKSDFLASMSHELRTPLNSVIGFSRILADKEDVSETARDMLGRIETAGVHLLGLVNQVLDVSKVEAGEVELDFELIDVAVLAREVLRELEGQKPRPAVELTAEIPDGSFQLLTDRLKLRQVISNLGANALKFTRQGSVTLRLECRDEQPLALEVVDTGIGISEDKLAEIFEPFTQADSGTSRKFDGTGLGLTICQVFCEAMGYRLEVDSQAGEGSVFRVVFAS